MAGVGHAAMHDGWVGALQRTNHALHLFLRLGVGRRAVAICLLPATGARALASGSDNRHDAFFSRYGHLAVAGAIASGIGNTLLIQGQLIGDSPWGTVLLFKCALVAGMVAIALVNRYVLVPRMSGNGSWAERTIFTHYTAGNGACRAGDTCRQPVRDPATLIELTG